MKKANLFRTTLLALFIAIIFVMDFTPLGYITTGALSITLMTIPVALGAVCIGPVGGAVLGAVFGLTSFLQCFGIGFFIDPSGAILFGTSPLATVITCFIPRILAGLITALVFSAFKRANKIGFPAFAVASGCMPILNTAFFMICYVILFKNTVLSGTTVKAVFLSALSVNLLVEFTATLIAGTVINKVLYGYIKRLSN